MKDIDLQCKEDEKEAEDDSRRVGSETWCIQDDDLFLGESQKEIGTKNGEDLDWIHMEGEYMRMYYGWKLLTDPVILTRGLLILLVILVVGWIIRDWNSGMKSLHKGMEEERKKRIG